MPRRRGRSVEELPLGHTTPRVVIAPRGPHCQFQQLGGDCSALAVVLLFARTGSRALSVPAHPSGHTTERCASRQRVPWQYATRPPYPAPIFSLSSRYLGRRDTSEWEVTVPYGIYDTLRETGSVAGRAGRPAARLLPQGGVAPVDEVFERNTHQGLQQRVPAAPAGCALGALLPGSVRTVSILGGLRHTYEPAA